ncbi:MAG: hypothetical protein JWQ98_1330 [Chlorobi bacterium]|nr:hypothetical protein [Chlorobiota bacterium]
MTMSGRTQQERLLETYEKVYYFEHDRQEPLFSRAPILLAVYSILLSVMAASIESLPSREENMEVWCLRAGLGLEALALLVSGWYTGKFLWFRHTYGFLIPNETIEGEKSREADE